MSWFEHRGAYSGVLLTLCYQVLKAAKIPQHVAFIMDGNRRYAKKENVKTKEGHSKGFEKLTEVLHWCDEIGIPEVTVYAFSIENFKRSPEEVEALLSIFQDKIKRLLDEKDAIMKHGICVRFVGNILLFDNDVRDLMTKVVHLTKDNSKSVLNIAVAYTSRDEITEAIKEVAQGVDKELITLNDINEDVLEGCFYTNKSRPVDLLIRTSGEVRLSDFLLWQSSFSILCFVDPLWPELSIWNFFMCILKYQLGYQDLTAAKAYSKLKESKCQMNKDMTQAYQELKSSSEGRSLNKEQIDEYTNERKERVDRFLKHVENKRHSLFFPNPIANTEI